VRYNKSVIEIEKTFLVKKLPNNLDSFPSETILQGYISSPPSPLRIRRQAKKFELTKKLLLKPGDFSSYEEINIPLTETEFNLFWPLVKRSLEKIRYYLPLKNNLTAEVNLYQKKLSGLVMVEVEFSSRKEMNNFIPPSWFGRDVTQEAFSANLFLAGKTYKQIKTLI
jgi:CYTH domain-containing protein